MEDVEVLRKFLPQGVTIHENNDGYVEVKSHLGEFIASTVRSTDGFLGGVRSFYGPVDLSRGVRGLKMAVDAYCVVP